MRGSERNASLFAFIRSGCYRRQARREGLDLNPLGIYVRRSPDMQKHLDGASSFNPSPLDTENIFFSIPVLMFTLGIKIFLSDDYHVISLDFELDRKPRAGLKGCRSWLRK